MAPHLLAAAFVLPLPGAPAQEFAGPAALVADTQEEPSTGAGDDLRRRDRPDAPLDRESLDDLSRTVLDWAGLRSALEDRGVGIELLATVDGSGVAAGSAGREDSALRGLVDLTFMLETGPAFDHEGGELHLGLQWIEGGDPSEDLGLLQPASGNDAPDRLQVARAWYDQSIADGVGWVRLGKMDANSVFAAPDAGANFVHSSMGLSPTLFLLPTYPDTAFGVMGGARCGSIEARAGFFDGAFARGVSTGDSGPSTLFDGRDEWHWIAELDVGWEGGHLTLGGWGHTADIPRFDGGTDDGTEGLHAVVEQRVLDARGDAGPMDVFLQWGDADPEVSPFRRHLGIGARWDAPFGAAREHVGLAVSHAELSGASGSGLTAHHETVLEAYHSHVFTSWSRVQLDVQYVANPGGETGGDDLLLLTVRTTVSL